MLIDRERYIKMSGVKKLKLNLENIIGPKASKSMFLASMVSTIVLILFGMVFMLSSIHAIRDAIMFFIGFIILFGAYSLFLLLVFEAKLDDSDKLYEVDIPFSLEYLLDNSEVYNLTKTQKSYVKTLLAKIQKGH